MAYFVKEIYLTRQGEGAHTGRLAVFCRFSGCNLWSGREEDRKTAICRFCDTEFRGVDGSRGGIYPEAVNLAAIIERVWPESVQDRWVVCTGGEPLLQLDSDLILALQEKGFTVAVETNGTLKAPKTLDWVCVSPKAGAPLVQDHGDELKLVYPQPGLEPGDFCGLDFRFFFLQPMASRHENDYMQQAITYCRQDPLWRLSVQTHNYLGLR